MGLAHRWELFSNSFLECDIRLNQIFACRTLILHSLKFLNPFKGEHSQSPCLLELKENIFHQLSSAGVVPLKLPNPVPLDGPNVEMSVLLLEYDILKALTLCSNIIQKGFQGQWANENEEKAISTFLNAMTSYFVNEDILIPSSSSPRLIRLENELVERVVSQFSHILSHQNIIRRVFILNSDWLSGVHQIRRIILKTHLSLALMTGKFKLTARILFKVKCL